MTNYLSYLGVILTSYFFGFNFSLLCKTTYDLFTTGGKECAMQFLILFWMYFSGLKTTIYNILMILIYNILINLDKVNENIEILKNEYCKFMEYYEKEVKEHPEKKNMMIEYFQKGILLKEEYKKKLNEKILLNQYYEKAIKYINNMECEYYVNEINKKIDNLINLLFEKINLKFPQVGETLRTIDNYKREMETINENEEDTELKQHKENLQNDLRDVTNMITMMDNFMKNIDQDKINIGDQYPNEIPSNGDFEKLMNEFGALQKITKDLDMNEFLNEENFNRSQRRKFEKLNKKKNK